MLNKLALVTGGNKGLGKAVVLELASKGTDVIVHYNNSEAEAMITKTELEKFNINVFLVRANFLNDQEIVSFFETQIDPILTANNYEGLDYLINNAGIATIRNLQGTTIEDLDHFLSINLKAPVILMKDAFQRFNRNGRIINITSTTVTRPYEKMVAYGASKAALDNVSKAVIKDFGKKGITVNTIAPGFIPTDIVNINSNNELIKTFILKNYAIKRLGSATDVAKLVAFLLSEDAEWINGQTIEISGGFLYN